MYLTPKIMGKVTGLGPAAILLSLSVWGALMGVIGMIIALPLTTLGISCYKHYVLGEPWASEKTAVEPAPTPRTMDKGQKTKRQKRKTDN